MNDKDNRDRRDSIRTGQKKFNLVGFIMDFEAGNVTKDEMVAGFQHMIDDGTVWNLQGFYGRTAERLIEAGLCHAKEDAA